MNEQENKKHTMSEFCKLNMVRLHHCFFHFMKVWGGNAVQFIQDYSVWIQRNVIYQNR